MLPIHAKQILEEIEKLGYKPKGRDIGLIESVKRFVAKDRRLTSGMSMWLQDIYRKAAGFSTYQERQRT